MDKPPLHAVVRAADGAGRAAGCGPGQPIIPGEPAAAAATATVPVERPAPLTDDRQNLMGDDSA